MPTPPGTACKVCLIASTRKHACIRALACCASRIGQLQLSAGLNTCRMHRVAQGLCNMATPRYRLQGMSDRIDTREQACTSIYYCGLLPHCAVAAVCNLFWLLPYAQGLCNMPTQPGTACSICLTGPTHHNRLTHLCQIVVQPGCTVEPVCCHLLVLCCFWLHRFVQHAVKTNTARYILHGMSDPINTREKSCTSIPLCLAA
jgi:hypothetical protein